VFFRQLFVRRVEPQSARTMKVNERRSVPGFKVADAEAIRVDVMFAKLGHGVFLQQP
jgi:hypothetical protein